MDCSLPGSSIHGIFQARVLEWSAIVFSNEPHYVSRNARLPDTADRVQDLPKILHYEQLRCGILEAEQNGACH